MTAHSAAAQDQERTLKVLVCAASLHGATAEIAEAIGQVLAERGLAVTVQPPEGVRSVDGYDAVLIGSAVYAGHWLEPAKDLVSRCREGLCSRPVWLFSSGPIGKPSGKLARAMGADPVDLPAMRAAARPRDHRMFAGKLDRTVLSPLQRAVLLLIRRLEGDFRDWSDIRQWADGIAGQLALAPASGP